MIINTKPKNHETKPVERLLFALWLHLRWTSSPEPFENGGVCVCHPICHHTDASQGQGVESGSGQTAIPGLRCPIWAALTCASYFAGTDRSSPIGATMPCSDKTLHCLAVYSSCLLPCVGCNTGQPTRLLPCRLGLGCPAELCSK